MAPKDAQKAAVAQMPDVAVMVFGARAYVVARVGSDVCSLTVLPRSEPALRSKKQERAFLCGETVMPVARARPREIPWLLARVITMDGTGDHGHQRLMNVIHRMPETLAPAHARDRHLAEVYNLYLLAMGC